MKKAKKSKKKLPAKKTSTKKFRSKKIQQAVEQTIEKYDTLLKKLAGE